MVIHRDPQLDTMCTARDFEPLNPKGDITSSIPSPQGSGLSAEEKKERSLELKVADDSTGGGEHRGGVGKNMMKIYCMKKFEKNLYTV